MNKTFRCLGSITLLLLIFGWFLFISMNKTQSGLDTSGFRSWFWERRGLDIIVQLLLIFGGALGIAAILPIDNNEEQK